jgi:hypothetical protein
MTIQRLCLEEKINMTNLILKHDLNHFLRIRLQAINRVCWLFLIAFRN